VRDSRDGHAKDPLVDARALQIGVMRNRQLKHTRSIFETLTSGNSENPVNPASDNEHGLCARALPLSEAEFDRIIRINRIKDLHLIWVPAKQANPRAMPRWSPVAGSRVGSGAPADALGRRSTLRKHSIS